MVTYGIVIVFSIQSTYLNTSFFRWAVVSFNTLRYVCICKQHIVKFPEPCFSIWLHDRPFASTFYIWNALHSIVVTNAPVVILVSTYSITERPCMYAISTDRSYKVTLFILLSFINSISQVLKSVDLYM